MKIFKALALSLFLLAIAVASFYIFAPEDSMSNKPPNIPQISALQGRLDEKGIINKNKQDNKSVGGTFVRSKSAGFGYFENTNTYKEVVDSINVREDNTSFVFMSWDPGEEKWVTTEENYYIGTKTIKEADLASQALKSGGFITGSADMDVKNFNTGSSPNASFDIKNLEKGWQIVLAPKNSNNDYAFYKDYIPKPSSIWEYNPDAESKENLFKKISTLSLDTKVTNYLHWVQFTSKPVLDEGCYKSDVGVNICPSGQYCLRDKCTDKVSVLPTNNVNSEKFCNYDEVYIGRKCEKAKANLLFVGNAVEDENEFNEWIDKSIAGLVTATELKNCPNKIRVHKIVDFCAPVGGKNVGQFINDTLGSFDFWIMLHPYAVFDYSCSVDYGPKGGHIPINMAGGFKTLAHEFMHGYAGFSDQYCYNPSPDNINPVDFVAGQCAPPQDDWSKNYCSSYNKPPYKCVGNPNNYGGNSIMGLGQEPDNPTYGFDPNEEAYLSKILNCD